MRDLLRGLLLAGAIVCFFLTFSFRVTMGKAFTKIEVGLVGPWLVHVDRAGKASTTVHPASGAALCGYSIAGLVLVRRLTRRTPRKEPP